MNKSILDLLPYHIVDQIYWYIWLSKMKKLIWKTQYVMKMKNPIWELEYKTYDSGYRFTTEDNGGCSIYSGYNWYNGGVTYLYNCRDLQTISFDDQIKNYLKDVSGTSASIRKRTEYSIKGKELPLWMTDKKPIYLPKNY